MAEDAKVDTQVPPKKKRGITLEEVKTFQSLFENREPPELVNLYK